MSQGRKCGRLPKNITGGQNSIGGSRDNIVTRSVRAAPEVRPSGPSAVNSCQPQVPAATIYRSLSPGRCPKIRSSGTVSPTENPNGGEYTEVKCCDGNHFCQPSSIASMNGINLLGRKGERKERECISGAAYKLFPSDSSACTG